MTIYTDTARAQAEALWVGKPSADEIFLIINKKIQSNSRGGNTDSSVIVEIHNPNTKVNFQATPIDAKDWKVTNISRVQC